MIYNLNALTEKEKKLLRAKLIAYKNYDKLDLLIELTVKDFD